MIYTIKINCLNHICNRNGCVFFSNWNRGNRTDFWGFCEKLHPIEAKDKWNELKMGGQLELMELKNKQSHKYSISFCNICIYISIDDEIYQND